MALSQLETFGPIEIPCDGAGRKKYITDEHIKEFWKTTVGSHMTAKQGCYIFALRVSKGFTPWYVGKATKSFKQEVFAIDKIKKYNDLLWKGKKGTPVMFFVAQPENLKKIPEKVIADMEKFLIQSAVLKNKNIINNHHTKNLPRWSIAGVIRSGQGKPSTKSQTFKTMMDL